MSEQIETVAYCDHRDKKGKLTYEVDEEFDTGKEFAVCYECGKDISEVVEEELKEVYEVKTK